MRKMFNVLDLQKVKVSSASETRKYNSTVSYVVEPICKGNYRKAPYPRTQQRDEGGR